MKNEQANLRNYARMLFVFEGKEMDDLEKFLGLPRSTLYYWYKTDEWEKLRGEHRFNAGEIARQINVSLLNIFNAAKKNEDGALTSKQADAIAKLNKVRQSVLKDSNYMGIAFDVIQRLQTYLRNKHPKAYHEQLPEACAEFLKNLLNEV